MVTKIIPDLVGNLGVISKKCFPNAVQILGRIHIQQKTQKLYKK